MNRLEYACLVGILSLFVGLVLVPSTLPTPARADDSGDTVVNVSVPDSLEFDFTDPTSSEANGSLPNVPSAYIGKLFMDSTLDFSDLLSAGSYAESFAEQSFSVQSGGSVRGLKVLLSSPKEDSSLVAQHLICTRHAGTGSPYACTDSTVSNYTIPPTTGTSSDVIDFPAFPSNPFDGLDPDSWGFTILADRTTPDAFAAVPNNAETSAIVLACDLTTKPCADPDYNSATVTFGTKVTKSTVPGLYKGQIQYTIVANP